MKHVHYSLYSLPLILLAFFMRTPQKPKELYGKTAFIEIDASEDSLFFRPYSKAWDAFWHIDADIQSGRTDIMNYAAYQRSFESRNDNLWTILHPKLVDGSITMYWPYDPETLGLGPRDDGELRYPATDKTSNQNFITSDSLREELCYLLGEFGPEGSVPLLNMDYEDSIITLPNGIQEYVYEPRDFFWYNDKSVVKFKLRVNVLVNKKGKEKLREIEAIAPVIERWRDGTLAGEFDMLWLDFEEIRPLLEVNYFFDANGKPVSYVEFFEAKAALATF